MPVARNPRPDSSSDTSFDIGVRTKTMAARQPSWPFLDVLGRGAGQHARERTDLVLVGHHRVGLVNGVDGRGLGGDRTLTGSFRAQGDLMAAGTSR